ncbi:MAG: hypothetical protein AAFV88_18045 [Planctomycetota bacterium]
MSVSLTARGVIITGTVAQCKRRSIWRLVLPYQVPCDCGRTHEVTTSQAGGSIECPCGQLVLVPRLSELRVNAGETAHRLSVPERIGGMIKRGELPGDTLCIGCGRNCDQTVWIKIQCEKAWSSEPTNKDGLAVSVLGWVGVLAVMLAPRRDYRASEVHGREIVVDAPIQWCSNCIAPGTTKIRSRRCRNALRSVPIYCELLREYPSAEISLDRVESSR